MFKALDKQQKNVTLIAGTGEVNDIVPENDLKEICVFQKKSFLNVV